MMTKNHHELDTVWEQDRYDSGLYNCRVTRNGDSGRLTVTLLGLVDHLLHEESVKVDRADTDKWRTRCETVISDPDLRELPTHHQATNKEQ